jgi:RNA polymerase sigma factor (sigma-70 family)
MCFRPQVVRATIIAHGSTSIEQYSVGCLSASPLAFQLGGPIMSVSDKMFSELFRTHNRELSSFARRRIGRQEAEDIVQDTFLRLLGEEGHAGTFEHPRSYLFRVASNLIVDARRKARVRSDNHFDGVDFDYLLDNVNEKPSNHALEILFFKRCLAALPPLSRSVFLLHRLYGLTYPEIAARLNVSLRTVNRRMIKASEVLDRYMLN